MLRNLFWESKNLCTSKPTSYENDIRSLKLAECWCVEVLLTLAGRILGAVRYDRYLPVKMETRGLVGVTGVDPTPVKTG